MLVGVGMGFLMVTRLNVSIAIVCMVSGDDGGRAALPQDGAVSQSDADWWQERERHPPNRPVAQVRGNSHPDDGMGRNSFATDQHCSISFGKCVI